MGHANALRTEGPAGNESNWTKDDKLDAKALHTADSQPPTPPTPEQAREELAYTLGTQAYFYGYPWIYLSKLRWTWVTTPVNPESVPYAALNHFWHARKLLDAQTREGGSPNNDTLYSVTWIDVRTQPVILSHPDMGDRYFTFEIACLDSDNFAYVGKRTTGGKAGNFAIIGPGWEGTLPAGVTALPPSPTASVLIFGRTLVNGPEDVATVTKLQDQYTLTPLDLWGKPDATLPERRDVWQPFDRKTDPLADFKTMNRAMTEEPPIAAHAPLLKFFAEVGLGPNQDIETMDEATKRGLTRAAQGGEALIRATFLGGGSSKRVNGWKYPPRSAGRAGLALDFVTRASFQNLGGIIANEPEEAVYLNTSTDHEGQTLNGAHHYVLRFPPGQTPKVKAFWSLTMYGEDANLAANPIDRFAIGDRTPGVKRDEDGGLTLYVQADSPGEDKESNWLPAPTVNFYVILRAYMPDEEIVNQTWAPPPLKRAD
jgi:hypothetical protein